MKIGDKIQGKEFYRYGFINWYYIYEILEISEPMKRFSKMERLLTVNVYTSTGSIVDINIKRWESQLF